MNSIRVSSPWREILKEWILSQDNYYRGIIKEICCGSPFPGNLFCDATVFTVLFVDAPEIEIR
jgi:hypothetical protein